MGGQMFQPVDIRQELQKARTKRKVNEDKLLKEAEALLREGKYVDEELRQRLSSSDHSKIAVDLEGLDEKDIYSLDDISRICIRYRLRFLDTKYFKPEFPYDALIKIKALERANETKIEKFKIVAPGEAFSLEDANKDPLLFAELGDGSYYLLHKWGTDLSWYRRILTWPLQDLSTFFITLVAVCAVLAFSLPNDMIVRSEKLYDNIFEFRMLFMTQCVIGLFFFIVFIGMAFHKSFSSMDWDSKCFN